MAEDEEPKTEDPHAPAVPLGTQILGTYEIQELINQGGMGEVYRAVNIHGGETVAIKIILSAQAKDDKILKLFIKEAKMLQSISHDAIVGYTLFTKDPQIGLHCLIMEFVDGKPFGEYLADGPLSQAQVKTLIRRLASGLEVAHKGGIIHRDLSPDNVVLPGGKVNRAKIIDFGIAKSSGNLGGGTLLEGQFAGKYGFVSPEQLGDFGGKVDARSDVYSLGLLAAAACLGKTLEMGNAAADAVLTRRNMPDLSGVHESLRPLITLMLQPDPENRPASMAEVLTLLDNPDQLDNKALQQPEALPQEKTVIAPSSLSVPSTPESTQSKGSEPTVLTEPPTPAVSLPPGGEEDRSPFGATSAPPRVIEVPETDIPKGSDTKGSRKGMFAAFVGVCVICALAVFAFLNRSSSTDTPIAVNDEISAPSSSDTNITDQLSQPVERTLENTPELEAEPLNEIGRRMAWLNRYDPGTCALILIRNADEGAVAVEAFSTSVEPFEKLLDEYQATFSEDLDVGVRLITEAQCAVLNFVKSLGRSNSPRARLDLQNDVLTSGSVVSGSLSGKDGRSVWLVLVDMNGAIINLTNRLQTVDAQSSRFSFRASMQEDADKAENLILALTSDKPLTITQKAPNGVKSSQLLPLVDQEMQAVGATGTVELRYFRLDR